MSKTVRAGLVTGTPRSRVMSRRVSVEERWTRMPCLRRSHLELRRPVLFVLPEGRAGVVAEEGAVPAGEDGGVGASFLAQRNVSNRVHAGVDGDQLPDLDAIFDRARGEAKLQQLAALDVAVLLSRQSRDRLVDSSRHFPGACWISHE